MSTNPVTPHAAITNNPGIPVLERIKPLVRDLVHASDAEFEAAWAEAVALINLDENDNSDSVHTPNDAAERLARGFETVKVPDATFSINTLRDMSEVMSEGSHRSDQIWNAIKVAGVVALKLAARPL